MILRGILDRSLSRKLTIRGFAPIKELARISKADYTYQRSLIGKQEKVITTFLEKEGYLFFPEIILSFKIKKDYTKPRVNKALRPIEQIETRKKFKSNVDNTVISVRTMRYKGRADIRATESLKIVTMQLDEEELQKAIKNKKHPFHRVDGNHRLSAADNSTSDTVKNMNTPFCIILSEELSFKLDKKENTGAKFDKVVFHNINTKTVPLTSEENLKVILDDKENFPDKELKDNFAEEYYATRQILKKSLENIKDVYPFLGEEFLKQPRTALKDIVKLLVDNKDINKRTYVKTIISALETVNHELGNHKKLQEKNNINVVVAMLYIAISKKGNLDLFVHWILKNHINDLEGLDSSSLVAIYKKIREKLKKQIFVSMSFASENKSHYETIQQVVIDINEEYTLDIKIREIRIDDFNTGHSYKIDDQILKLIEESGLLIADLSAENINVYQELGYLMGINQGKNLRQENFILIKKQKKNSKDSDVGFNIRPFQQLRFKSEEELYTCLKKALEQYYDL